MENTFIKLANSAKFKWFLLRKLPAAYFSGVRIKYMDEKECRVVVPYTWFSQNPFRSTYFACLAMAAELSTGALAMANVYKRQPSVSMLIVKVDATYHKKASSVTTFICTDGLPMKSKIDEAIRTGEPQLFTAISIGTDEEGNNVATFTFTWSFKVRQ